MTIVTAGRSIPSVEYRCLITDVRTKVIQAELPIQKISYSNLLSAPGSLKGEIQINKSTSVYDLQSVVKPLENGIFLLRNGFPIWGGILKKITYTGPERTLSIEAGTFEDYFNNVRLGFSRKWVNTDQFQIAREIVQTAASSVNISVSNASSSVQRKRSVYLYENKNVGVHLQELSDLINGFDYNVVLASSGGSNVNMSLQFWNPRRGISKTNTTLSFEYPGAISSYTYTEDAFAGANRVLAVGAGEGEEMLRKTLTANPGGYPWIDKVFAYKTVEKIDTLTAHATSDLTRLRTPVVTAEIIVRADIEPILGSYEPGDWARFVFNDEYFTPRKAMFMRIIGYTVTLNDSGIETVRLVTNTERDEEVYGE